MSEAEQLCAGYGAYAVWMIVAPERFGLPAWKSEQEMLHSRIAAQKELRAMFSSKPNSKYIAQRIRQNQTPTFYRALAVLKTIDDFRPTYSAVEAVDF